MPSITTVPSQVAPVVRICASTSRATDRKASILGYGPAAHRMAFRRIVVKLLFSKRSGPWPMKMYTLRAGMWSLVQTTGWSPILTGESGRYDDSSTLASTWTFGRGLWSKVYHSSLSIAKVRGTPGHHGMRLGFDLDGPARRTWGCRPSTGSCP